MSDTTDKGPYRVEVVDVDNAWIEGPHMDNAPGDRLSPWTLPQGMWGTLRGDAICAWMNHAYAAGQAATPAAAKVRAAAWREAARLARSNWNDGGTAPIQERIAANLEAWADAEDAERGTTEPGAER